MNASELLQKPYGRLVMPDEDGSFTAEIVEFPGCIASGKTRGEALDNLESVAVDWIAASLAQGQEIPEPLESSGYSGKLVVRMAKGLHKRAALCAERDGVSLNQFIVNCISEHVGMRARPWFLQSHPAHITVMSVQLSGGAGTYARLGGGSNIASSFAGGAWLLPGVLMHARS